MGRWACFQFSNKSKAVSLIAAGLMVVLAGLQNCAGVNFNASKPLAPLCRPADSEEVKPKVMWDWQSTNNQAGTLEYPTFNQVMAAPMVADLDNDGRAEVAFISFSVTASDHFPGSGGGSNSSYRKNGVLRIIDGPTGKAKVSVGEQGLAPQGSHSPLLIDLDGDGKIEIVYLHFNYTTLVALNSDGSKRWLFETPSSKFTSFTGTGFTGTDVNGDGRAEIVFGPLVIAEQSGAPKVVTSLQDQTWSHRTTLSAQLHSSFAGPQVVNPFGVFDKTGAKLYSVPPQAQYFAVANLYPEEPGNEIIATGGHRLFVINGLNGQVIVERQLGDFDTLQCPNGAGGGAPTIGNFDSDANLEIAVATGRHLTIFDRQGIPKYKTVTQDCSSLVTGITSFDFNGDSKPEILYGDEEYFRIFEVKGSQLEVIHQVVNPSGTLYEYPVVADINSNYSAEILVVSNNYAVSGFYQDPGEAEDGEQALSITGIRAFTSAEAGAWMPTRPLWNQYSFHPDFFTDRGQVRSLSIFDFSIFRRNNQGYLETGGCRQE